MSVDDANTEDGEDPGCDQAETTSLQVVSTQQVRAVLEELEGDGEPGCDKIPSSSPDGPPSKKTRLEILDKTSEEERINNTSYNTESEVESIISLDDEEFASLLGEEVEDSEVTLSEDEFELVRGSSTAKSPSKGPVVRATPAPAGSSGTPLVKEKRDRAKVNGTGSDSSNFQRRLQVKKKINRIESSSSDPDRSDSSDEPVVKKKKSKKKKQKNSKNKKKDVESDEDTTPPKRKAGGRRKSEDEVPKSGNKKGGLAARLGKRGAAKKAEKQMKELDNSYHEEVEEDEEKEEEVNWERCPFSGCNVRKVSWESLKAHLRGSHFRRAVKLSSQGGAAVPCPHCALARPTVDGMLSHIWSHHMEEHFPASIVRICQRRKTRRTRRTEDS